MCIDTQLSHACAYEPFHAFPRHAGKFTPPKQRGGGGGERRETESPITFSISGRVELSSGSRRTLGLALVLIINAQGSGQVAIFSSLFPYLSSTPHLLFSYATNALDSMHRAFASRGHYTLRWVIHDAPRVGRIAKSRHSRPCYPSNNEIFGLMSLRIRPE